ncbi:MAG: hypothetical protein PHC64_02105 [Candidatus Gastranaerophilales bacterium]|nr:hypothetical protein [Candidatus Gastranaerophilales bacterium]
MNFWEILFNPAIVIVVLTFFSILIYYVRKVGYINSELMRLLYILKSFKKADLIFKFKELDDAIANNPYSANCWAEFKNTLVFSESLSLKDEKDGIIFENVSQSVESIQTTIDPIYFFNEETLITSKMNYKFIQAVPTILTGLGPLFTFLNIAIAFAGVNFSTQEATVQSISHLMASMQVAALVSVLAVGSAIIFIIIERILYNNKCKLPLNEVQEKIYKLFDNISSEKFLIELLKETKIQNNSLSNLLTTMPNQIKESLDGSLTKVLVPYLENLIFGVNKLQEKITKEKSKSDIVDDLF